MTIPNPAAGMHIEVRDGPGKRRNPEGPRMRIPIECGSGESREREHALCVYHWGHGLYGTATDSSLTGPWSHGSGSSTSWLGEQGTPGLHSDCRRCSRP